MTPEMLIAEARTWLGVPFRHQGRSRLGVDCAGWLEVLIETTVGLPADYSAPRNYSRLASPALRQLVEQYCTPAESAAPGIMVLLRWPHEQTARHIGLCTGETLIHAYAEVGRVVEHGYRGRWLKLTDSLWRLPGISYG